MGDKARADGGEAGGGAADFTVVQQRQSAPRYQKIIPVAANSCDLPETPVWRRASAWHAAAGTGSLFEQGDYPCLPMEATVCAELSKGKNGGNNDEKRKNAAMFVLVDEFGMAKGRRAFAWGAFGHVRCMVMGRSRAPKWHNA